MNLPLSLKLKYLKNRLEEIERAVQLIEINDFSMAKKMGHQTKGNAVTFGLPQIGIIGFQLERAADFEDKVDVLKLIKKMKSTIQQAQNQIQASVIISNTKIHSLDSISYRL